MTPEKKAERLVKKNFYGSADIPQSLKKRPLHKTRKGNEWKFEVGERGIVVRYSVIEEEDGLHLRRAITKFDEEKHLI